MLIRECMHADGGGGGRARVDRMSPGSCSDVCRGCSYMHACTRACVPACRSWTYAYGAADVCNRFESCLTLSMCLCYCVKCVCVSGVYSVGLLSGAWLACFVVSISKCGGGVVPGASRLPLSAPHTASAGQRQREGWARRSIHTHE